MERDANSYNVLLWVHTADADLKERYYEIHSSLSFVSGNVLLASPTQDRLDIPWLHRRRFLTNHDNVRAHFKKTYAVRIHFTYHPMH